MKEKFPWWLWVMALVSVWPVLLSPVFIFGNPFAFNQDTAFVWRVLLVFATNLPWIVPVITLLWSFDLYRRGWYLRAAVLGGATAAASIGLGLYLFIL